MSTREGEEEEEEDGFGFLSKVEVEAKVDAMTGWRADWMDG